MRHTRFRECFTRFFSQAKHNANAHTTTVQKQTPLAARVALDFKRRVDSGKRRANINSRHSEKVKRLMIKYYRAKRREIWHTKGSFCNLKVRFQLHEDLKAFEKRLTSIYRYPVHERASTQSRLRRPATYAPLVTRLGLSQGGCPDLPSRGSPQSMRLAWEKQAIVDAQSQSRNSKNPTALIRVSYRSHPRRRIAVGSALRKPSQQLRQLPKRFPVTFPNPAQTTPSGFPLTQLVAAFSQYLPNLPNIGSFVDFSFKPRISVPKATELTENVVEQLTADLDRFADELKQMSSDIRRLASLGELPVSLDNGSLRVHFANCDFDRLKTLMADEGVHSGTVGSHEETACHSQNSDISSMMSPSLLGAHDYSTAPSSFEGIFPDGRDTCSVSDFSHLRRRSISSSVDSSSSMPVPSLTHSSSDSSVSEVLSNI